MDSIEKLARLRISCPRSLIFSFIQISLYMIESTTGTDLLGDLIWNIRVPDHYLEFQHRSLIQCAEECLIRKRCKAFSFSQKMNFCVLSPKVENRRSTKTSGEAAGFVTSNIASWPQVYIGKCANHNCSENEKCDTESGRCEISDCGQAPSMPVLATSGAPSMPMFPTSGHHETGYGILYTCMENLTMVIDGEVKQENEEVIMCNDGKWENRTVICVDMSPTTPSSNEPSTTPSSNEPSTTPSSNGPSTASSNNEPSTVPSSNEPSTTPSSNEPSTTPSSNEPSTTPSSNEPSTTPSSNGPSNGQGDWMTIQARFDGSEDFNRNWDDYKNGFGKRSGEFWLGNEELYLITSKGHYQLRIELEDIHGNKRQANYKWFSVASEGYNYRLSVSGYHGNAGDSLTYHIGNDFSTKDKDNDRFGAKNCASTYKGGWWYNSCFLAHLNGMFPTASVPVPNSNMAWLSRLGTSMYLKSCKMMIKRHYV